MRAYQWPLNARGLFRLGIAIQVFAASALFANGSAWLGSYFVCQICVLCIAWREQRRRLIWYAVSRGLDSPE